MAKSKRLVVQVGNGASPTEVFAFTCGANQWSVQLENTTGEAMTFDCTDPLDNEVFWERWTEAQNTTVTMSGTVTQEAWQTWRSWSDSGAAKNTRIIFDESSVNHGGHWTVPTILTSLELTKEGGGVVNFSATLTAAGRRVWTAAT
ncbi:hypothetical protein GCM10011452_09190 [Gemmobacter lanyuensis]|uniref:Phage tail protein n=1 Tax=Gemmobacter lanyuensis TaxID=1054497 RepID=A0A918IQD7_9RHOB|nr:phage tail tube protein [Gemmobacter lanyuensis]GGW23978.1 hypothetical protein GCM10011452_09190 [Gemmobacter lanyuensis]